jgi:hypothetical protein
MIEHSDEVREWPVGSERAPAGGTEIDERPCFAAFHLNSPGG